MYLLHYRREVSLHFIQVGSLQNLEPPHPKSIYKGFSQDQQLNILSKQSCNKVAALSSALYAAQ
jgi:hypothetical protein